VRLAPAVGTPAALAQALGDLASDAPLIVLGDGARRYEAELRRGAPAMRIEDVPVPLAAVAARVAQRPDLAVSPHALRPIYLRRPDAVLARERAGADGPGEFHVRRASGTDDLGAVEALQRRAFTNAWGAEAIRWELEHTDVARLYVLERPDGEVVAYCACWMVFDELHINSLAVDEGWRRRGLARRLLKAVFREAVAAGARSATLEVRRSNMPAQALYEGLGFRVEGVRRDYYQQPREDALVLWHRRLAEQAN
jgi:ribosomal-protein-alanine N-acetyltransferase